MRRARRIRPVAPWSTGTSLAYMQQLVDYWREHFDWRAQEAKLNAFSQFTVPVSGRITAVAVDPTPPPALKTLTSRDTNGGGTVELHTSCGPNSSHPFTPCDEEFIRFCTILGGNSDIQEPSPGDLGGDEPSGTCDVPGPEAPHPQHD